MNLAGAQQRLREQAEHHLRVAAMEDLRRQNPQGTTAPHRASGAYFWRFVFVPLYRRVPWEMKEKAMRALRMTAESNGWTPPARRPGEPWRPPPPPQR
jgi:phage baseplate assembly protein W